LPNIRSGQIAAWAATPASAIRSAGASVTLMLPYRGPRGDSRPRLSSGAKLRQVCALRKNRALRATRALIHASRTLKPASTPDHIQKG
jgi:hypothetical protein